MLLSLLPSVRMTHLTNVAMVWGSTSLLPSFLPGQKWVGWRRGFFGWKGEGRSAVGLRVENDDFW